MCKDADQQKKEERKIGNYRITDIPPGFWKLDPLGKLITDGVDEMYYLVGFGYVML